MQKYNRLSVCLSLLLSLSACGQFSEDALLDNPKQLEAQYQRCLATNSAASSCETVEPLYKQWNKAFLMAQIDPQGFGRKILALQQELEANQIKLVAMKKQNQSPQEVKAQEKITHKQQKLNRLYMAVVKTLESPET